MSERWIHVTARLRGAPCLDDSELPAPPDPTIAELVALAIPDRRTVLVGGEPTLRADLPHLLRAFPSALLRTDGLALATPGALRPLRDAGLVGVRVLLHAAVPTAHDWLVGAPGAAKRAIRALQLAKEAGLRTEIEAALTRSNAPILAQLVELGERLGVRAVHLRSLERRGRAEREPLAVSSGMLEGPIEEARARATRGRIDLVIDGSPSAAVEHAHVPR